MRSTPPRDDSARRGAKRARAARDGVESANDSLQTELPSGSPPASTSGSPTGLDRVNEVLEAAARRATQWVGGNWAFALACSVVIVWIATGPLFGYSDTWQLVINTGTTVVTFLMVFLIQRAQNKESRAMQLKLNEIVAALEGASNRLIGAEELSERDLEILRLHYAALVERIRHDVHLTQSHSIEEAERRHARKLGSS